MRYVYSLFCVGVALLVGCTPTGEDPVGDLIGIDDNTGAAGLTFSPETLAFESTVLGQSSDDSTVTVTAQTGLTISAITLVDSNYTLVTTDCVKALAKNSTCTMSLKFNPVTEGITTAAVTLTFTLNKGGSAKTLSYGLSGTGTADDSTPGNVSIAFSPQFVDFSNVTVGSDSTVQTAKLYASYNKDIYLNTLNVNNQNYSIIAEDCPDSATALVKGTFCSIQMKFAPLYAGSLGSSLKVTYGLETGQSNLTASLALSGTGVGQLSFDGIESFTSTTTTATTLNWTDISGASFYLIYRIISGTPSLVATQAAPASAYGVTGLSPSTTYTYRVNAINAAGDSDGNSNSLSVTTDTQGAFTAIADLALAEGATGSTPAFSCTDAGANAPSYTLISQSDTDTNCAINSGKVTCTAINYKTGHSAWTSNLSVRCDLNGSSFTNTFAVNVSDTNRSPSLTAIGNQSIIAGAAITSIDADDGGDDADVDTDTLRYTCTYGNDQGTAAGTSCASLPNSSYSFNTGTGVLAWTASTAAAVGNATTIYTFTITASDQQGAPLTDTETFTVTVAPAVALASKPDLIPANSSALVPGSAMTQIDYDNTVASNDTSVTYTCHFDTTIDGSVTAAAGNECDDDLDTYGTASFNTSTGVFDWTPAGSTNAMFEFYITATLGSASANDLFVAFVQEQYTLTNMLSDLDARFATGTATQSGAGDWEDLSSNNFDGNQSNGTWSGTGAYSSPYQLQFDGTSTSMDMGTVLNGESKTMISSWISSDDITKTHKTILSTGADTGNGVMVTQSTTAGTLRLYTGTAAYRNLVNSYSPTFYWRMDEASGNIVDSVAARSATVNGNPTYAHSSYLQDGGTSINFDGTGDYFVGSDASFPSGASSRTIAAWVYPTNSAAATIIAYGTTSTDQAIVLSMAGGNYFFIGPWGPAASSSASYGTLNTWYHVAFTYDGSVARLYVNGAANGTLTRTFNTVLNDYRIGLNINSVSPWYGRIDEVTIIPSVLTANQIKEIYQAGVGCVTTTAIANNQWNMFGVLFDGTTASLHLNGRQECSFTPVGTFSASTNLTVGATSAGANYWDGSMADLKTYSQGSATLLKTNFDKTADRFRQNPIYNVVTDNLVAHLDASNAKRGLQPYSTGCVGGETSWYELSPYTNVATLIGFSGCAAPLGWHGTGAVGDPYYIGSNGTGTDEYVEITNSASLQNIQTADYTLETWVRTNSFPAGTGSDNDSNYGIIHKIGCHIGTGVNGGGTFFMTHFRTGCLAAVASGTTVANTTAWYHVVGTVSRTSGRTRIYVNGTMETETTWVAGTAAYDHGTYPWRIGIASPGAANWRYAADIRVAVARIYNVELTAAQVSQNCNAQEYRFTAANDICN